MERWLWTQKQDIGPSSHDVHSLAYDSIRDRIVLFDGGTLLNTVTHGSSKYNQSQTSYPNFVPLLFVNIPI